MELLSWQQKGQYEKINNNFTSQAFLNIFGCCSLFASSFLPVSSHHRNWDCCPESVCLKLVTSIPLVGGCIKSRLCPFTLKAFAP